MTDTYIVKKIHLEFPRLYSDAILFKTLAELADETKAALCAYLFDKIPPKMKVNEFTVEVLTSEYGMNSVAALFTLDWIKREPVVALASLNKGHDKIEQ